MSVPPPSPTEKKPAVRSLESYFRLPGGPRARGAVCFLYYLAIIVALLLIYGRGDFVTAPFVYQGF